MGLKPVKWSVGEKKCGGGFTPVRGARTLLGSFGVRGLRGDALGAFRKSGGTEKTGGWCA